MKTIIKKLESKLNSLINPSPAIHIFVKEPEGYLRTGDNKLFSESEYQNFCDSLPESKLPQVITVRGVSPDNGILSKQ